MSRKGCGFLATAAGAADASGNGILNKKSNSGRLTKLGIEPGIATKKLRLMRIPNAFDANMEILSLKRLISSK